MNCCLDRHHRTRSEQAYIFNALDATFQDVAAAGSPLCQLGENCTYLKEKRQNRQTQSNLSNDTGFHSEQVL